MAPEVLLHPAGEDADAILRERIGAMLGIPEQAVQVGRLCGRCGSSAHGRPRVRIPGMPGLPEAGASISRSGPHLLTGLSRAGGIGVDIESVAAVESGWDAGLVLHPSEAAQAKTPGERAAMWCRKEAILKLLGTGLDTPMHAIRASDFDVRDVPAPQGYRAAVAVAARLHRR